MAKKVKKSAKKKASSAPKVRRKKKGKDGDAYFVQLQSAPSVVVMKDEVDNQDGAIAYYKKLCGIVRSDHPFKVTDCNSGDIETTLKGVVVGSLPSIKQDQIRPQLMPDDGGE